MLKLDCFSNVNLIQILFYFNIFSLGKFSATESINQFNIGRIGRFQISTNKKVVYSLLSMLVSVFTLMFLAF